MEGVVFLKNVCPICKSEETIMFDKCKIITKKAFDSQNTMVGEDIILYPIEYMCTNCGYVFKKVSQEQLDNYNSKKNYIR